MVTIKSVKEDGKKTGLFNEIDCAIDTDDLTTFQKLSNQLAFCAWQWTEIKTNVFRACTCMWTYKLSIGIHYVHASLGQGSGCSGLFGHPLPQLELGNFCALTMRI